MNSDFNIVQAREAKLILENQESPELEIITDAIKLKYYEIIFINTSLTVENRPIKKKTCDLLFSEI